MLLDSSHHRWVTVFLILLAVATGAYVSYASLSIKGPAGGSWPGLLYGGAGFALMLYAGVLGARRKVPTWRVGRATAWMKGHLWLGLLSYALILFHSGFQMGGPLTMVLMVLFTIVVASGIYGVVLQQFIPRMMLARLPLETVYEQIDSVVGQLQSEADEIVSSVVGRLPGPEPSLPVGPHGGGGLPAGGASPRASPRVRPALVGDVAESSVLRDVYLTEIRPYLDRQVPRNGRLLRVAETAGLFAQLRNRLPSSLRETVSELEAICEERRQLAQQKRLHHWLQGWLLVHVPLSLGLLFLSVVHALMAVRY